MKTTNCNDCGQMILVKILEATVPALCPLCGPAYTVAKTVSNNQGFSQNLRSVASLVCIGFILFAGAKIIDDTLGA